MQVKQLVSGRGLTAPFLILALLVAAVSKWLVPELSRTPMAAIEVSERSYIPTRQAVNTDFAPQMHASTVRQMVDGRLQAAWFAGTGEGHPDVVIRMAEYDGQWRNHRTVLTREQLQATLGQSVRKLGNPVLATLPDHQAMLFVVSVGLGGWATAQINVLTSTDDGQSWQLAEQAQLSPFLNMSFLVRNRPTLLSNGQIGLPAYHELATTYPQWLTFSQQGQLLGQTRLTRNHDMLQPVVLLDESGDLQMWARPGHLGEVMYASGHLGGKLPVATGNGLTNGSSGIDVIRMQDGRLLMAVNDAPRRNRLSLYTSVDGEQWQLASVVRNSDNVADRFGYPWLEQTPDGSVHLLYTENRRQITHHVLEGPL